MSALGDRGDDDRGHVCGFTCLFNRNSNEKGLSNLRRKGRRNEEPGGLDIADDRFDQVIARLVLHKQARRPRLFAVSAHGV